MTSEEIKSNISVALYELSRFRAQYDHGKTSWHNRQLDHIQTLLTPCIDSNRTTKQSEADKSLSRSDQSGQRDQRR